MLEGLWFQTAAGAGGVALRGSPGGVRRQVAFPGSHLVDASCQAFAQAHEGARVGGRGVVVVGAGGNRWDQSLTSGSLTLCFRAEYVHSIRGGGGRLGKVSGIRCVFIMGIRDRPLVKAIDLWATASIGR